MHTFFPTPKTVRKANSNGFRTIPTFSTWIDDIVNDALDINLSPKVNALIKSPAVNILELNNSYEIEVAAPGLVKSEFKIDLKMELLTISSEQKTDSEDENNTFTRREFDYSSFKRSFQLPKTVNKERISANYTDGILRISLPKLEESLDSGIKQIDVL